MVARRHHSAWLTPLLLAALGLPAPSVAQGTASGPPPPFRLIGQVRDLKTRRPIPGALVELPARHALRITDDSGYFAFDSLRAGTYRIAARRPGYVDSFDSMSIHAHQAALIWLQPDPTPLPDIGVVVRRQTLVQKLDQQVKATGYDSSIIGPEELGRSTSPDLTTLLEGKAAIEFTPCPGQSEAHFVTGALACIRYRGGLVAVHVSYNDLAIPGDLILNESPRDFYLVQFVPELHMLRLYTYSYIEDWAKHGWNPEPICIVCAPMGRANGG